MGFIRAVIINSTMGTLLLSLRSEKLLRASPFYIYGILMDQLQVFGVQAEGRSPLPLLSLQCKIVRDPSQDKLDLISISGIIELGGQMHRTNIFMPAQILGERMSSISSSQFQLIIPLSPECIEYIDEIRGDQNVLMQGRLDVLAYNWKGDKEPELKKFWPQIYDARGSSPVRIPRSDWFDMMKTWGVFEKDFLEIYIPHEDNNHMAEVYKDIQEANLSMRQGEWGNVLTSCRKALEAMRETSKNIEFQDFLNKRPYPLGEEPIATKLNNLTHNAFRYACMGPHPGYSCDKHDAILMYQTTVGLYDRFITILRNKDSSPAGGN